jgi:hypothetical protein
MANAESTAPKQRLIGRPFVKGQSGNPAGRPRGSRQVISDAFLRDAYAIWQERGISALRACADTSPEKFCSIIAGLLPREAELAVSVDIDVRAEINHLLEGFRAGGVKIDKPIRDMVKRIMAPTVIEHDAED